MLVPNPLPQSEVKMNRHEVNEMILEHIRQGRSIVLLDKRGELRIWHIEHTDAEMLSRALPLDDVRRLLRSGGAE